MKKDLFFRKIAIMAALAFFALSGRTQALDITKVVEGTVKGAKGNSIEIIDDADAKEAQIAIDSNTVYDNVQKLADLKVGDKVQINFKTYQSKNIAITITKLEIQS